MKDFEDLAEYAWNLSKSNAISKYEYIVLVRNSFSKLSKQRISSRRLIRAKLKNKIKNESSNTGRING